MTTIYPGYIRTRIHDESNAMGLGLEGRVPAEDVRDAAKTIARAALGPPVRDLATTRSGKWFGLDGLVQFLNPWRRPAPPTTRPATV